MCLSGEVTVTQFRNHSDLVKQNTEIGGHYREKIMPPSFCLGLKGFFAFIILSSHIYGELYKYNGFSDNFLSKIIGVILQNGAFLSVGIFFFISGFGIISQYEAKKNDYISSYWTKRIVPMILINIFLVFLYSIFSVMIGKNLSVKLIFQSMTFGKTIVRNGWYIQTIIIFYILIFFVLTTCKNKRQKLCLLNISTIVYWVICALCKLPATVYECSFCIPFGMYAYYYIEPKLDMSPQKQKKCLFLSTSTFLAVLCLYYFLNRFVGGVTAVIVKVPLTLLFCVLVMQSSVYFPANVQNIFTWLGKYSLGI